MHLINEKKNRRWRRTDWNPASKCGLLPSQITNISAYTLCVWSNFSKILFPFCTNHLASQVYVFQRRMMSKRATVPVKEIFGWFADSFWLVMKGNYSELKLQYKVTYGYLVSFIYESGQKKKGLCQNENIFLGNIQTKNSAVQKTWMCNKIIKKTTKPSSLLAMDEWQGPLSCRKVQFWWK